MAMANMNLIGVICNKVMACTSVSVRRQAAEKPAAQHQHRRLNKKHNTPKKCQISGI